MLSASIGAGHDTVARELIRQLADRGEPAIYLDVAQLLPAGVGTFVRRSYEAQLRSAPRSYEWLYRAQDRSRLFAWGHRRFASTALRRLRKVVPDGPAMLVATSPDAAQVVGLLRGRGITSCPTAVVVTDFAAHRSWMASGIDRYIVVHELTRAGFRARGAADVVVAGPTVRPPVQLPATRAEVGALRAQLRRDLGLAIDAPLALVAGGSWGVGAVEETAAALAKSGKVSPVVLCGHNRALQHRLADAGVVALGWRDDVAQLMQACDLLVENAGGQTAQEAFAAGLPVVTVAPLPGHGVDNAQVMAAAGVTTYAPRAGDLPAVVDDVLGLAGRRTRVHAAGLFRRDAAEVVVGMLNPSAPSTKAAPRHHRRRIRMAATVAATVTAVSLGGLPAAAARDVGVRDRLDCAQRCVHIAVRLSSAIAAEPALLREVEALHATVTVPDDAVALVSRISPQTPVASPAEAIPGAYELTDAVGRHRRLALFAGSHPTMLQVGMAFVHRDRTWRPAIVETPEQTSSLLPVDGVVLVDLRRASVAQALAALDNLQRAVATQDLTAEPLPTVSAAA